MYNMGNMRHIKFCVILVILYSLCFANCQKSPSLNWQFDPFSTDQWFKQKLDHYDSSNIEYWPQRYVTSYRFYRLGGPVFLFLSGPGPELTLTDIESGAIAEYAQEQGAFVIGLEHRFYGKSRPTQDLSTKNLQFLTVPQTIEDIAAFIRQWRAREDFKYSKWAIFGASYLGSLATWFAQKHPELIDAFVASSPPLELRYEIPEFLENVGIVLNKTDPKCYETIAEGFTCLQNIFNEKGCENYNLGDVKTKFNLCADLDPSRPLDASGAIAELFSTVNAVVMYHDPNPESFPDTNIDRFCRHITREEEGKSALDKIGEKVQEINKHRNISCAEFRFETTVEFLDEKEWDSDAASEGYRQLQWQLCNELGWTVASANISQPFGNYLSPFLHAEICQKLFGLTETEMRLKVLQANTELKGKNINTQCGIFVNGDLDPWHTYSITTPEEAGKCNRAILIEGGSHGRDIEDFTNTPSYPPSVREAQIKIARYLDHFLKTGKCCEEDARFIRAPSSFPRPVRAPNPREFYSTSYLTNDTLRKPMNVHIRPRGEPSVIREKLVSSPTSMPLVLSTTDVLSVSPRIPVAGDDVTDTRPTERKTLNKDNYRDPRNSEFRRYRVVKLLRHRPSFAPPDDMPSPAPSMEQFEADFPEHSLRVEGRVERVFKNGTKVDSIDDTYSPRQAASPRPEIYDERLKLYNKGRKHILQTVSPNEVVSPTPKSVMEKGEDETGDGKQHFRYVVKQVFRDVVEPTKTDSENGTNSETHSSTEELSKESQKPETQKNSQDSSNGPKKTAKRRGSLEESELENIKKYRTRVTVSEKTGKSESSIQNEPEETIEDVDDIMSDRTTSDIKKRESSENPVDYDSKSLGSSKKARKKGQGKDASEITVKVTHKQSKSRSTKTGKREPEDDDYYDDEYPSEEEYYDDDYDEEEDKKKDADDDDDDDDEDEDDEKEASHADDENMRQIKKKNSTLPTTASSSRSSANSSADPSKDSKVSNEFSSGEDLRPLRLREKISKKIMSSSEDVEGDQKSKEKAGGRKHNGKSQSKNESEDSGDDEESVEDSDSSSSSKEFYSDEDDNFSLEPSGSNPQGQYRKTSKKQLAPIAKPAIEEPSTVINVEISGSYPRRSHRIKKTRKVATTTSTTEVPPPPTEAPANDPDCLDPPETEKPKRRRIVIRRRKHKKPSQENLSSTSTTTTTTTTTTSTTTTEPTTSSVPPEVIPPTNNYATWNRGRFQNGQSSVKAQPIQQYTPELINLNNNNNPSNLNAEEGDQKDSGNSDDNSKNNNDVLYIIIGDIPNEEEGNNEVGNGPPSPDALFRFIQKLVNRHSAGTLQPKPVSLPPPRQYYLPPTEFSPPPPTETTTLPPTTTTVMPPPPYLPPVPPQSRNLGYDEHTGKYLLVRPVQVVALGREHLVHANDLKNESFVESITMRPPPYYNYYPNQIQNTKRGYDFKSPVHRDNFERLLSVDGQVRDSDRSQGGYNRHSFSRRLDQIPDPTWRSIRGVTQFGPVIPPSAHSGATSGLLSLSAADTMWVDQGVPFLPRGHRRGV